MEREKTDIFSRESQRESGRKGKLQRACLAGRGNKKKIKGGTFFTWGADITGCRQLSGRGEGLEPQVAEETAREVTEYGDSRSPSLSLSLYQSVRLWVFVGWSGRYPTFTSIWSMPHTLQNFHSHHHSHSHSHSHSHFTLSIPHRSISLSN